MLFWMVIIWLSHFVMNTNRLYLYVMNDHSIFYCWKHWNCWRVGDAACSVEIKRSLGLRKEMLFSTRILFHEHGPFPRPFWYLFTTCTRSRFGHLLEILHMRLLSCSGFELTSIVTLVLQVKGLTKCTSYFKAWNKEIRLFSSFPLLVLISWCRWVYISDLRKQTS